MTEGDEERVADPLAFCMALAIAAIAFFAVDSCASVPIAPPAPTVKTVCLPMTTYSQAQEQAVAAELAKLAPDDPVAAFIVDYGQMRAADRACLAQAQ